MYCRNCGSEIEETTAYCGFCGSPTQAEFGDEKPRGGASPSKGRYKSFEYASTAVDNELVQVAVDSYESLGYEFTGRRTSAAGKIATLSFRRNRKVRGKAQLAKIQRSMDDTIASIERMEEEKSRKAVSQALAIGIVSALVLGLGMCCTMVWDGLMALGIVIGLLGIAGCVVGFLRYRTVLDRETARLAPNIEKAYDSLATLCEEAQAALRGFDAEDGQ